MDKILKEEELNNILKSNILIIDHSNLTRSVISSALKDYGFNNIVKAKDSKHAISILEDNKISFDLLTSDIDDADMGFDLFLSKIRAINKFENMAYLIISDKLDISSATKLLSLNVEKFLKKPFTSEDLCKTTVNVLKEHLYPDSYTKNCREISKLIDQEKLDEALLLSEKTIKLNSIPTYAVYFKAYINLLKGSVDLAKSLFLEALSLKENHLKSLIGISFCYKKLGENKSLYDTCKKIISIDQYHIPSIKELIKGALLFKEYSVLLKQLQRIRFSFIDNDNLKEFITKNSNSIFINVLNVNPEEKDIKLVLTLFKEYFKKDFDRYISLLELLSNYSYTSIVLNEITEIKTLGVKIADDLLFKIDINILFNSAQYDAVILECKRYLNKSKPSLFVYQMLIDCYIYKKDLKQANEFYKNALNNLSNTENIIIKDKFCGVLNIC